MSLVEKPLRRKYTEILNENIELIESSKISPRTRKVDINKEYKIFDQKLLKLQNKYFNEIELNKDRKNL